MITDYASLQQAIADWLARADLTNQIPTFIQLAEARMSKDLRVLEMQSELVGTVSQLNKSMYVPPTALELQSVRLEVSGRYCEVHPLTPDRMQDRDIVTGIPLGYVRVGDELYLIGGNIPTYGPSDPPINVAYQLLYFAKPDALGTVTEEIPTSGGDPIITEVTSNWLLQKEPGLYLYASLIEASPYLQDDARTLVWAEQYKSILSAMKVADDNARYGNAPSGRIRGWTP